MSIMLLALAAGQPLQPVGKWVVSYNQSDCTMQRSFGEADHIATFGFRPTPTQVSGDLVLVLPGRAGERRGKGRVTLQPGDRTFTVDWARGALAGDKHGFRISVEQPFWDALPSAQAISFDIGEPQPVVAALGTMVGPMAAVKACGDDLLRHWGADPDHVVRLEQPATVARWFDLDAYPPDALRAHEQGRVYALTLFDQSGTPVDCHVVVKSGSLALDQATCDIMMHRGRVAADSRAPERRFLFVPVRWVLPD